MTSLRKDVLATLLTGVAVLAFAATHEAWNVPLIGSSHRWAAALILLLGMATCGLGSPVRDRATRLLAGLGVAALALAAIALATGSLTALSLLVVDFVALWALSTARHLWHAPHHPVAT
jgi:hypothetical protein